MDVGIHKGEPIYKNGNLISLRGEIPSAPSPKGIPDCVLLWSD